MKRFDAQFAPRVHCLCIVLSCVGFLFKFFIRIAIFAIKITALALLSSVFKSLQVLVNEYSHTQHTQFAIVNYTALVHLLK